MTMLISRPNCFIMALIAGVVISYRFVLPLQAFLTQKAGLQHTHAMILMAMALMMVIGLLLSADRVLFQHTLCAQRAAAK